MSSEEDVFVFDEDPISGPKNDNSSEESSNKTQSDIAKEKVQGESGGRKQNPNETNIVESERSRKEEGRNERQENKSNGKMMENRCKAAALARLNAFTNESNKYAESNKKLQDLIDKANEHILTFNHTLIMTKEIIETASARNKLKQEEHTALISELNKTTKTVWKMNAYREAELQNLQKSLQTLFRIAKIPEDITRQMTDLTKKVREKNEKITGILTMKIDSNMKTDFDHTETSAEMTDQLSKITENNQMLLDG